MPRLFVPAAYDSTQYRIGKRGVRVYRFLHAIPQNQAGAPGAVQALARTVVS